MNNNNNAWENGRILWFAHPCCDCPTHTAICDLNEAITRLTEWGETLRPTDSPAVITRLESLEGTMAYPGEVLASQCQLLTLGTCDSVILRNHKLAASFLQWFVLRSPGGGEYALFEGQGPISHNVFENGWHKIVTGNIAIVSDKYATLTQAHRERMENS